MFDRIARVYDLMNSVMTAGLHHRWRERAADLAGVGPGDRALDVATGTGDLAIALARRVGESGEVIGSDFSERMLELARAEMAGVVRPGGRVVFLEITTPGGPPLSIFFRLWFDRLVPLLGRVAGDPESYSYLPSSVRRFPNARGLAAAMAAVGLVRVRWIVTAGGIIAIHVGTVEA